MSVADLGGTAGAILEAGGIIVIAFGALLAFLRALPQWLGHRDAYRQVRQRVGRAVLLGLELLVGADIIRTVTTTPELGQVLVLGLIVLVRTFLSFSLQMELEGRWPWQKPTGSA